MLYFGDLSNLAMNLGILPVANDLGPRDRTPFKPRITEIKVFPRSRVGLKTAFPEFGCKLGFHLPF